MSAMSRRSTGGEEVEAVDRRRVRLAAHFQAGTMVSGGSKHACLLTLAELEGKAGLSHGHGAHVVERRLDLQPAADVAGDALPDDEPPSRVDRVIGIDSF
jgi:hypothetical protein